MSRKFDVGIVVIWVAVLAVMALLPSYSYPEEFSFEFSNDVFAPDGSDRWLSNFVALRYDAWEVGSEMYTPTDKRSTEKPVGDRPWDGYSYVSRKFVTESGPAERNTLEARLGALGVASGARDLQKFVHNDLGFGSDPAWVFVNRSVPSVDLIYERASKTIIESAIASGIATTRYGTRLGNVRISGFLDAQMDRVVGCYHDWCMSTFTGARGELVAFNTFLDGRLFVSDKYTIDSQEYISEARVGFVIHKGGAWLKWAWKYLTEEFEGQEGRHLFGGVTVGTDI